MSAGHNVWGTGGVGRNVLDIHFDAHSLVGAAETRERIDRPSDHVVQPRRRQMEIEEPGPCYLDPFDQAGRWHPIDESLRDVARIALTAPCNERNVRGPVTVLTFTRAFELGLG
jgi:hypothetical protein